MSKILQRGFFFLFLGAGGCQGWPYEKFNVERVILYTRSMGSYLYILVDPAQFPSDSEEIKEGEVVQCGSVFLNLF